MYREPLLERTSPVPKDDRVVEPLEAMVSREEPVEELTVKTLVVGRVDVPWTDRVAMGELLPTPTRPLALTVK